LASHSYQENDTVLLTGDFNVNSRSSKKYQPHVIDSIPVLQGLESLKKLEEFHEYDALLSCLSDDHKDEIENLLHVILLISEENFNPFNRKNLESIL